MMLTVYTVSWSCLNDMSLYSINEMVSLREIDVQSIDLYTERLSELGASSKESWCTLSFDLYTEDTLHTKSYSSIGDGDHVNLE